MNSTLRTFIFQPIGWRYNQEYEKDDEECIITVDGVLENGEDIICEIYEFKPYIVIELPQNIKRNGEEIDGIESIEWDENLYDKIYEWFRTLISDKNKKIRPVEYSILNEHKVYQKLRKGNFIKLHFLTHYATMMFRRNFEDKIEDEYVPHSVYCKIFQTIFSAGEFKIHETNINPLIKFIIQQHLLPSGWIEVQEFIREGSKGCNVYERQFSTACYDCCVYSENVKPADSRIDPSFRPKIKVVSFDIETFSINFNSKMPDPLVDENEVYSIGACIADVSSREEEYKTYILSLENPPDIPGVTMLRYKTERDLLVGFAEFLRENENPYIMLGHNIYGFDWDYLIKRAKLSKNDCYNEFAEFTKMTGEQTDCTTLVWNSKAYKNMSFKYMNPVGRINFDIMIEAERQGYRLRSFALNSLGEAFLGEFKKDLPYRHQFMIYFLIKKFRRMKSLKKCRILLNKVINKDDCMDDYMNINELGEWKAKLLKCSGQEFRKIIKDGHALLLEYLKQDVILPMKIFHKMNMWTGAQQASNIFRVPIDYLQTRGQQIKVLAQIYGLVNSEQIILGHKQYEKVYDWNLQGALVQDIIKGYHENVLTFDFTSLYPSIIIANNICYSTVDEDLRPSNQNVDDLNIIDWTEHKFCGCESDPYHGKKGKNDRILCSKNENIGTEFEGHYRFQFKKVIIIKDANGNIIERRHEGIYPKFLRTLLTKRKAVKKQIKIINKWVFGKNFGSGEDRSTIENWVLNKSLNESQQIVIEKYKKHCETKLEKIDLEFIRETLSKNLYENPTLNTETIYALLINLVVLDKKQLAIKISANSGYGGLGTDTSAVCFKPGAACTTATGRKFITLGIEHTRKVFTSEKLSEIFQRDVEKGFHLVYGDSVVGDEPLLLRNKHGDIEIKTISELGDEQGWKGYCDENDADFKPLDSVASNRREKQKSYVEYDVWANGKWNPIKKVIRHKTNKRIYRISTHKGIVDVTEDHSLLNEKLEKLKPNECIIGETKLSHSYPTFVKYEHTDRKLYWGKSKKSVAESYYDLKSNGYGDIFVEVNKNIGYNLHWNSYKKHSIDEENILLNVEFLRYADNEFVYDLETEDGIFQCGIGEIQVKNTDSFMGCFPALTISESWKMINHIQDELDSGIFPDPIHLEFECMYGKYFQLSKKCYVSWMMEPKNKDVFTDKEIDWIITSKLQKGVVSSRRDNCKYTTIGFDKLMEMALCKTDKYIMRNYVADYAYKLMSRGVENRNLVVTKGVGNLEDYEKEDDNGDIVLTNQGHIKLADKMFHLRGEDVQNTRLQFVFVKRSNDKIRLADLKQEHVIEDYTYFKNNFRKLGMEPHYQYYLTHTIESHFDKILDYKDKPLTIFCEKLCDKLEKEREVLEDKIHHSDIKFLNNLLVPMPETIKTHKGEKYKLFRQTFLINDYVEVITKQLKLEKSDLNTYISLLKQRHSMNIIKNIQNMYGFTSHGGGLRGDKENNHIMVDGTYTKKLIQAHVKYHAVIKDLRSKFLRITFIDPFKEE